MEPMRTELGVGVGSISMVGGVLAGATMLIGPAAAAFVNRSLLLALANFNGSLKVWQ